MDIRKLQRAIVDGLEDVKAQNIAVFNTEHLSAMFERVIIASGTSNRQTKALASSVRESVRSRGMQVMATEGEDNGEWIIVDCGAAVAHIMQPSIREYYHLEEIWGGKNVKIKLGDATTRLVKASEPEAPARKGAGGKPVAGKAPAKRFVTRPAAAKSAPVKTAAKTAAKAPAKSPAKAPAKPASVRTLVTAPVKKAAAKKTAAKKTAASKAGSAKPAARKTAAKPVAAKKAPARKR